MTKALTLREVRVPLRDGLSLYLSQIRKFPVLTRERERELAQRWFHARDPEAGRTLALSNLRFVVKVAKPYTRYGFKLPDLIQEGNMGLLHALKLFDPRKGFRLISYAVWWIRAYIQAFILRSWSIVRMGTTRVQRRIFSGLQKARRMIASLNSGGPVPARKVAEFLEVPESDLKEAVARMQRRDVSLEQPVAKDSTTTFGESLADDAPDAEEALIRADLREKVRGTLDEAYDGLTPRERYLLEKRLLSDSPVTLEAAGHEFGVTRERVRQIEERLKGKLRRVLAPALGEPVPA